MRKDDIEMQISGAAEATYVGGDDLREQTARTLSDSNLLCVTIAFCLLLIGHFLLQYLRQFRSLFRCTIQPICTYYDIYARYPLIDSTTCFLRTLCRRSNKPFTLFSVAKRFSDVDAMYAVPCQQLPRNYPLFLFVPVVVAMETPYYLGPSDAKPYLIRFGLRRQWNL